MHKHFVVLHARALHFVATVGVATYLDTLSLALFPSCVAPTEP